MTPLAAIVAVAIGVLAWLLATTWWRTRRRAARMAAPLPAHAVAAIDRNVPAVRRLPPELRARLESLTGAFVAEKEFVGCNGLVVTDEMRSTIAALACLLVLARRGHYDDLHSILVYPTAFWVEDEVEDEAGVVSRRRRVLSGEAWDSSRIILRPRLAAVYDVPADQGGRVALTWIPSDWDRVPFRAITGYRVWRRAPYPTTPTSSDMRASPPPAGAVDGGTPSTENEYWERVADIPAAYLPGYAYVAESLQDSTEAGVYYAVFMVQAFTPDPYVFYNSDPDSGCSVDNLAPPAPSGFAVAYTGAGNQLHWGASPAPDLREFRLYRGPNRDFVPSAASLVLATRNTAYVDIAGAHYYKLVARSLELISQLLLRLIKEKKIELKHEIVSKVTYHDPCHLGRHSNVYDTPREILKAIPGLEFVEMDRIREISRCCGAGGGFKAGFSDIQNRMAQERVKDAEKTGADRLVTSCPFCYQGLQIGINAIKAKLKMTDLSELVALSMVIEAKS